MEKSLSKVWAALTGARRLGGHGRGHPGHRSPARAWTARFSRWGAASLARWTEVPGVSAGIPAGRAGASLPVALLGEQRAAPRMPRANRPGLGTRRPVPTPPSLRSRQRGGARHLDTKMCRKSGLKMRGGSPQRGGHRLCLFPPLRLPVLPPPPPPPGATYSGSGGSRRPGPTPPAPDKESRAPRTPGRAPAAAGSASAAA